MSSYKEIVTKAIIGKGRKNTKKTLQIKTEEIPNTILGCWVINHKFEGFNNNNKININGSYDVNIWYSYENDTKTTVSTKTINYIEEMTLRTKENNSNNNEIIVRSLKQPTVSDVKIKNDLVELQIEGTLGVEIVGDSKFKVMTDDGEDDWEELEDELEELDNLDENYIKDNNE